jgi:hypothetical protein
MDPPDTLGEAWHLLQARADMCYFTGKASRHAGDDRRAERSFQEAVDESGDFQRMAVVEHSEMSYYRGLALLALGRPEEAHALFAAMKTFAEKKAKEPATIDYFATSLPLLLVFDEDLERRNHDLPPGTGAQGIFDGRLGRAGGVVRRFTPRCNGGERGCVQVGRGRGGSPEVLS